MMENLKVKVKNESESKEIQELFFELGYKWINLGAVYFKISPVFNYITAYCEGKTLAQGHGCDAKKELTIPQLRDMVVLKRNSIDDATHKIGKRRYYLTSSEFFEFINGVWVNIEEFVDGLSFEEITPTMQEYLVKENGQYVLHAGGIMPSGAIVVPEGAEALTECMDKRGAKWLLFWKKGFKFCVGFDEEWYFYTDYDVDSYLEAWNGAASIVWQRHTQPEELLFIDDEPKQSLNDTYAEIEAVRQDNVNHPSHYASGDIECIDAIESSMTPEAFKGYLKGNVQKYMWRYEHKGGKESLEKAQWYLNKLISRM